MQIQLNITSATETLETSLILINEDNTIEWPDFPDIINHTLIGFVKYNSTARREILDLDNQTFWAYPDLSVAKYIVLQNDILEWVGTLYTVDSVELLV